MGVPYDYQTDWTRIARLIVHDALRTAPGERVLIHADPTYFPALTEAVRCEGCHRILTLHQKSA